MFINCTKDQLLSRFRSHSIFIILSYIYFLSIYHMPSTVLTLEIQLWTNRKKFSQNAYSKGGYFLTLSFAFLISSPLISVQISLLSGSFECPSVRCFAAQLKRVHILGCQQSLCSCTTQQSSNVVYPIIRQRVNSNIVYPIIRQKAHRMGSTSSLPPEYGTLLQNGSNDLHFMVFIPVSNLLSH